MIFLLFFWLLFTYWAGQQKRLTWCWKHQLQRHWFLVHLRANPRNPQTLMLWLQRYRAVCSFCFVKKSWTHILPRSAMQQLQMMQTPQPCLLIFAPYLIAVGNVIYIYIMQSGSLYLAKTYQLLCLSSLCFSHTQRVWETPQECPIWCVEVGL